MTKNVFFITTKRKHAYTTTLISRLLAYLSSLSWQFFYTDIATHCFLFLVSNFFHFYYILFFSFLPFLTLRIWTNLS